MQLRAIKLIQQAEVLVYDDLGTQVLPSSCTCLCKLGPCFVIFTGAATASSPALGTNAGGSQRVRITFSRPDICRQARSEAVYQAVCHRLHFGGAMLTGLTSAPPQPPCATAGVCIIPEHKACTRIKCLIAPRSAESHFQAASQAIVPALPAMHDKLACL